MNPRLTKEARPLLIPWATAAFAILALLALHEIHGPGPGLTMFRWSIWVISSASLAARIFAAEFQDRTLSLWLSQPVTRSVMWRDKFFVLLPAIGALTGLYLLNPSSTPSFSRWALFVFGLVSVVASIVSAPYWASIARSTVGTFVFVLAAQVIAAAVWFSAGRWIITRLPDALPVKVIFAWTPYLAYTVIFFRAGWRRFDRLEAVEGLPTMGASPMAAESGSTARPGLNLLRPRPHGAWRNLARKELYLQKPNFILTLIFVVSVLAVGVLDASGSRAVRDIVDLLRFLPWAIYGVVLTLLTGSTAFCEERSLGIHTWSIAQPSGVRSQFLVKFGISLSVFVVLGLLVPIAVFMVYRSAVPDVPLMLSSYERFYDTRIGYLPLFMLGGFAVSFWISSLMPDLVRAGLTTLVIIGVPFLTLTGFLIVAAYPWPIDPSHLLETFATDSTWIRGYKVPNLALLGFSLMILVVLYPTLAAYFNFRRASISVSCTVRQLLGFFCLCCIGAFSFAVVLAQPIRIQNEEGRMFNQLMNAVRKLDEANTHRSPGDIQTYSWQQVEATGMLTAETRSSLANPARTITVVTLDNFRFRAQSGDHVFVTRARHPDLRRRVRIQVRPELKLSGLGSLHDLGNLVVSLP